MFKNKKGQSTVEYVVLVTAVVGVVLAFLLSENSPFKTTLNNSLSTMTNRVEDMTIRLEAASAESSQGEGEVSNVVQTPVVNGVPCLDGEVRNATTGQCDKPATQ